MNREVDFGDDLVITEEEQFASLISFRRGKWRTREDTEDSGTKILLIICSKCNFAFGSEHINFPEKSSNRRTIQERCIEVIYEHEKDCKKMK